MKIFYVIGCCKIDLFFLFWWRGEVVYYYVVFVCFEFFYKIFEVVGYEDYFGYVDVVCYFFGYFDVIVGWL